MNQRQGNIFYKIKCRCCYSSCRYHQNNLDTGTTRSTLEFVILLIFQSYETHGLICTWRIAFLESYLSRLGNKTHFYLIAWQTDLWLFTFVFMSTFTNIRGRVRGSVSLGHMKFGIPRVLDDGRKTVDSLGSGSGHRQITLLVWQSLEKI